MCAAALAMLFGVKARLRGGQHEAARLDRAGAQQNFPMRLACQVIEGCRNRQDLRPALRQSAEEMWEAQVVADRHADPGERHVRHNRARAGPIGSAFAIDFGL